MKCHSCGCDNREGAKFCGECAAPLAAALACPSCGTANPKGGSSAIRADSHWLSSRLPILAPTPRSTSPKKILTSRSALEGERKHRGDGIMALFGAPIAHEDHAQRACYAALHLKDELRRYSDELQKRLTVRLCAPVRLALPGRNR